MLKPLWSNFLYIFIFRCSPFMSTFLKFSTNDFKNVNIPMGVSLLYTQKAELILQGQAGLVWFLCLMAY